jgi:hypothetical protein
MPTQGIDRLVGEFMDRYQDWDRLRSLAREGSQAYNEGSRPLSHILSFDSYPPDKFHERFLGYLLDADVDPFKTARGADDGTYVAV